MPEDIIHANVLSGGECESDLPTRIAGGVGADESTVDEEKDPLPSAIRAQDSTDGFKP